MRHTEYSQRGMSMLIIILIVVGVIIVGGGLGYYFVSNDKEDVNEEVTTEEVIEEKNVEEETNEALGDTETAQLMIDNEATNDAMKKSVDDDMMELLEKMTFTLSGELIDVTGSTATGTVSATFDSGIYSLSATFSNLPELENDDFYEGWVVRKSGVFDVLSVGKVEQVDGVYTSTYVSGADLTDHDFYVLTLEPNDDDPSPADHILEGTMNEIKMDDTVEGELEAEVTE